MTVVRAPAKINLDLRVLYRRPDGYHEIRTLFQTISLCDEIAIDFHPGAETSIRVLGNIEIEDNLVARAARMVLEETGVRGELQFHLEKRIPMGAGLGGGSSDAAAVLIALPRLFGKTVPMERLRSLAVTLGCDVPFFLYGGTAVGLGRGEELYPMPDAPAREGLLVAPQIHVSTVEAYRALSQKLQPEDAERKRAEFGEVAWTMELERARNDFETVVFDLHPELRWIRDTLENAGAICARMTGSGAAVFGLFRDAAGAEAAHRLWENRHRAERFTLLTREQIRALQAGR